MLRLVMILMMVGSLVDSAIIGSTIYTLSRQFQYKITQMSNNQNIVEYATFTPKSECQKNGFCFYGWIDNFTIGNEKNQGFDNKLQTNNPIFYLQYYPNSSFRVISNNALPIKQKLLLEVTAKLLAPMYALSSNLSASDLYEFASFDNWSANSMLKQLDLQQTKFAEIVSKFNSSSDYVGWNKANSKSDLILYNKGLNCLMGRKIEIAENNIKVEIQLISKSIFSGLKNYSDIINEMQNKSQNIVSGIINESIIFPKEKIQILLS